MLKKALSLLAVILLANIFVVPTAFASVSYKDNDMEIDYGSESRLSSSELSRCKHYPSGESGDENEEYGFYDCNDDNDERDFEDFFSESEIKDIMDDFSEEYDYNPWSYSSPSNQSSSRSSRPSYTSPVAPNYYPDDTRVCTYQPTADRLGQFLDCASLEGTGRNSYAYYNDNIFPKLNPRPANYYYGYYY